MSSFHLNFVINFNMFFPFLPILYFSFLKLSIIILNSLKTLNFAFRDNFCLDVVEIFLDLIKTVLIDLA